jgi:twitching motility two-component system response regulator PilH
MHDKEPEMAIHKIMVVDDSASQRMLLVAILNEQGYEVVAANDGNEAVTKSLSEMPDLIIMDVIMPNLNGFQATRAITTDEKTWHIPVILLTSKDMESDRIWGLRQGATAFLHKPVEPTELIELLHALR